jgi:hypothetical protein
MANNTLLSSDTKEKKGSSQLPTFLAGPILRRLELNQVCIWIACSKAVDIRAEVFLLSDLGQKTISSSIQSENNSTR